MSWLEKLQRVDRKLYAFCMAAYSVLKGLYKKVVFCTACVFVGHCIMLLFFVNMPLWIYALPSVIAVILAAIVGVEAALEEK
jgi:hypothetical protein